MPGVLRAVYPAYAALAPGGTQGPWLPEAGAKRAWQDSAEDRAGCGCLGLDAYEGLWEPCHKRPRLGEERSATVKPQDEDVVDLTLKRPTPLSEELAKRRRTAARAPCDELAVDFHGPLATCSDVSFDYRREEESAEEEEEVQAARRVARRLKASDSTACTDIVACRGIVPSSTARILSCIHDAFVPSSLDFRDAEPRAKRANTLRLHFDQETLNRLGTASGSARRLMSLEPGKVGDGLPGSGDLVLFCNGECHVEPLEPLLPQADEPEIPGFVIFDERRPSSAAAARMEPGPQYGPREVLEQDERDADDEAEEEQGEAEEEAQPMVL